MSDLSGQAIRGYELQELLGEGAFGAVYRARQSQVQREVAIKVILAEHANRPEFIRRFEAEAQIVARLEHLHIVPLYDYWREPDGAYLVMRLMKGGSLANRLEAGPLSPPAALEIIRQIGSALQTAHQRGIIHRDLKPANILLDEDGNGYLSDFGIAKDLGADKGLTLTGAFIGTPAYTTPEQVQSAAVSPQTDIYSLGVILYEMLAGGHPFPDTPLGRLIVKHLSEPLPSLRDKSPELPTGLDEVIQRATAKEPAARYANTLDLVTDLQRVLVGESVFTPDRFEIALDVPNPYKGLRAFQEGDVLDFFGRESLTGQLLKRLTDPKSRSRFLAVVGPSGSGKSSVVKAGLIPAIRKGAVPGSEGWFIVEMLPGEHPLEELARGLQKIAVDRRAGFSEIIRKDVQGLSLAARLVLPTDEERLLLVIDQFEELFTLAEDPVETTFLLDSLCSAVTEPNSPIWVVITLRADFYDRPLSHPEFGGLMERATQLVLPLTTAELAAAIRGPAERVGAVLEGGLVADIVADVRMQPGALPLLQYALTELFERRQGGLLTQAAYKEIGGVLGALGRRAEEIYTELETAGQTAAKQFFLRLVTLGEGSEDTRRRVLQSELADLRVDGLKVESAVIPFFGRARLLTFDRDPDTRGPTVEVAHESLLREWKRLHDWLDESRTDVRMQRLLAAAAAEWRGYDRDPGYLLSDSRLDQFEAWARDARVALNEQESHFLEISLRKMHARQADEAERLEYERRLEQRSRRMLRLLVAVLAAATIVATGLSVFAFNQQAAARQSAATAIVSQGQAQIQAATAVAAQQEALAQAAIAAENAAEADTQQAIAEREAGLALARELAAAAISVIEDDPTLALLLALQSVSAPTGEEGPLLLETEDALHRALSAAPPRFLFSVDITNARSVSVHPDGSRLATLGSLRSEPISGYPVFILDISPGARGEVLMTLLGHTDVVVSVAYSPVGNLLATGSADQTVKIWDVSSGQILRTLFGHTGSIQGLSFSPDGSRLASASQDRTVRIWEVSTGSELFVLMHTREVRDVVYGNAGQRLISTTQDETIIWNVETNQEITTLGQDSEGIIDLAVSRDGVLLATMSSDGTVGIWESATGKKLLSLCCQNPAVQGGATAGVFNSDGTMLITLSRTSIKGWEISGENSGQELFSLLRPPPVPSTSEVAASPDGMRLFAADLPGGVNAPNLTVWDFSTNRELPPLSGFAGAVSLAAYNADGTRLATIDSVHNVSVWNLIDINGGVQKVFNLPAQATNGIANDLEFSPDGNFLATAGPDRLVRVWGINGETAENTATLSGHTGEVHALAYHPSGAALVSASADQTAIVWDLETGEDALTLRGHTDDVLDVAFNHDGTLLATASADTTTRIWNAANGRSLLILRGHDGPINSVAFSPSGDQLVTASDDRTAIVWDVASGEELFTLSGHTAGVTAAVFTPDGRRLITGSADGVLIVWDAASGRELFVLSGHDGPVLGLAVSPDGSRAVSAGADHTVNFYILDPEDLVAYIQSLVKRSLTPAECQRYLHVEACPAGTSP